MKNNTMRCLHAAYAISPTIGVAQQMEWEKESIKGVGLNWDVYLHIPRLKNNIPRFVPGFFLRLFNWFYARVSFYSWLIKAEERYDVILLRYVTADIFQFIYVLFSKKSVYFVHHTLELQELKTSEDFFDRVVKFGIEYFLGKFLLGKSRGSIGVTSEITKSLISRGARKLSEELVFPNGVSAVDSDFAIVDKRTNVQIVFVASYFYDWHGLDILLNSIKNSDKSFVLHLVGKLSERDFRLAQEDSRIVIHDTLNKYELAEVMSVCCLGLGSFALNRKGMEEACTLKVRDYFLHGLPVYSGHKDAFPDGFEYYKFGLANIDDIVDYADSVRFVSKETVLKSALSHIDKKIIVTKLYGKLARIEAGFRN